jgi:hypothetical protein
MAQSEADLTYGDFDFKESLGHVPKVGQRVEYKRPGQSGAGALHREMAISLEGTLRTTGVDAVTRLKNIQEKWEMLATAMATKGNHLTYSVGSGEDLYVIIDDEEIVEIEGPELPTEWGQWRQDYSVTLRYVPSGDSSIPRTIRYGKGSLIPANWYYFYDPAVGGDVPTVGIKTRWNRKGAAGSGSGYQTRTITINGRLTGYSVANIQAKVNALELAMKDNRETLYVADNATTFVNDTVRIMDYSIPGGWDIDGAAYTVNFEYLPLDEDDGILPFTVSYGGHTFLPVPVIGRSCSFKRASPSSKVIISKEVKITLRGELREGSAADNETKWDGLLTKLSSEGGVLVYGPYECVGAYVASAQHDDVHPEDILPYTIVFTFEEPVADGILEISTKMEGSCVFDRRVWTAIPYVNGESLSESYGFSTQTIRFSGTVRACKTGEVTAIDNAVAAAEAEIDAFVDLYENAKLLEGGTWSKDTRTGTVTWNQTYKWEAPPLHGVASSLYGETYP